MSDHSNQNSTTPSDYEDVRRGVFLSDLHLFSPRSRAGDATDELAQYQGADQCVVLGGDIFDFRWSDRGDLQATLRATHAWLEGLLAKTKDCRIVFLPGNHDCHPAFLEQLEHFAQNEARFSWHAHTLQIGDCVFLHGDILDAGENEGHLNTYRQKFHHETKQSQIAHRSYDAVVAMRVHKLIPKIRHRPAATCARLSKILGSVASIKLESTRRVFFGHTHNPVRGLHHNGKQFFNPGAALKHMTFRMVTFTISEDD